MPIYTKTGDRGTTSVYGGKRISKSDLQVEAYGSVDELTSYIGLVNSKLENRLVPRSLKDEVGKSKIFLIEIQKDLYKIIAYLSGAKIDLKFLDSRVKTFEKKIDAIEKKLPKLTRFILPGGTELSSWFHILRTICRRSERNIIRYFETLKTKNYKLKIVQYLNRLSDLFFTLARFYNRGKDLLT